MEADIASGTIGNIDRTQGELAAELGTTRSTLNRALQAFPDLGYVKVADGGGRARLLRPQRLVEYIS